jgi:arylsulfatase A-like enzyme
MNDSDYSSIWLLSHSKTIRLVEKVKIERNAMKLIIRTFTILCGILGIVSTLAGADLPNIVFILTDDLGYNQIGANGATNIKTPNIDRLAEQGIRFTQAYSGNTVCSPSRVSLFTGRDGRLMENNSNTVQLTDKDQTLAHVLKFAGYDTGLFGKYSIGSQMGVTDPLAMGFDTWFGMYSILEGHRQYPTFLWRDGVKVRIEANEGGRKGAYAQELFTIEAINYIREDHDNPFFVFLSYTSPHAELGAPEEYMEMYEGKFQEKPYIGMSQGKEIEKYAAYYPYPVANPNATLAAMITALDDYVGQVYEVLEEKGIADNTLIFFTSDNGPHDEFADVFPTFAEIAGVSLNSIPRLKTNGVSIAPLLKTDPDSIPERLLYWEFGKQAGDPNSGVVGEVFQAARLGQWKAVRQKTDKSVELFHIIDDPAELNDQSRHHPEIHRKFVSLFEEYAND